MPYPSALRATVSGSRWADDRLAERHRLEREDAVPAGVQLVDDDVGPGVALARLLVVDALDDVELDRQLLARLDHEARALLLAVRGGVDDQRARAVARRLHGERAQVEARRYDVRPGHPAQGGVGADDLGVRALAVGQLLGRLAADVGAEVVEDAPLAGRMQDRELQRRRHERQRVVEVKDVRARQQPGQRRELGREPPRQAAVAVERPVGLRMQLPPVEHHEPRVDPLPPQRLHVLPRNPGDVDRRVRDARRSQASHSSWSK